MYNTHPMLTRLVRNRCRNKDRNNVLITLTSFDRKYCHLFENIKHCLSLKPNGT